MITHHTSPSPGQHEPASAEARTVEARSRRSRNRGEGGGGRRRDVRVLGVRVCAPVARPRPRPPDPSSFRTLLLALCLRSRRPRGHSFVVRNYRPRSLDGNAAISGRRSPVRPSVRPRPPFQLQRERARSVRPRRGPARSAIPFIPSPPGKLVLIWCPRSPPVRSAPPRNSRKRTASTI